MGVDFSFDESRTPSSWAVLACDAPGPPERLPRIRSTNELQDKERWDQDYRFPPEPRCTYTFKHPQNDDPFGSWRQFWADVLHSTGAVIR